jgi:hypothetical protein
MRGKKERRERKERKPGLAALRRQSKGLRWSPSIYDDHGDGGG